MELITKCNNYISFPLKNGKGKICLEDIELILYKEKDYKDFLIENNISKYKSIFISNWETVIDLQKVLKEHTDNLALFIIYIKEIIVNTDKGRITKQKLKLNKGSFILGVLRKDTSHRYSISFIKRSNNKLLILDDKEKLGMIHKKLKLKNYDKGLYNILEETKSELEKYEDETDKFISGI